MSGRPEQARFSRRRWITVACGVTAATGVGIVALRTTDYVLDEAVARGLRVLSPWHFLVLDAVGRRLLAPNTADVARFADDYLVGSPRSDRADLLDLVLYVEQIAPVASGFGRRFTALGAAEQTKVLADLERSKVALLRGGFQALKALALMAHYRRPDSWGAVGYDGPVVDWSDG